MSDERPCKRSRTEDGGIPALAEKNTKRSLPVPIPDRPPPAPKKDMDIWFPSGNVIIVANYQMAFRVYQSILSRRSEVFRGLFELPPPPDSENIDGCPVVHLSDSPADLKHLLLVIYARPRSYFYRDDEPIPIPFSILSSLIRMSHKYGVQDIYDTAIARLKKFYCSDLDTWVDKKDRKRFVETVPADALAVIELAHLTDTPALLPTAYLVCCSLADEKCVRKRTRDALPILSELSPYDHKAILVGKARLVQRRAMRFVALLRVAPCSSCAKPSACALAVQRMLQRVDLEEIEGKMHDEFVLDYLGGWFWGHGLDERLCTPCSLATEEAHDGLRLETWKKLPELFGIQVPGWPDACDPIDDEESKEENEAKGEEGINGEEQQAVGVEE